MSVLLCKTLAVFLVKWLIIPLTGLLSLIREVMQRGPALLIFTVSALNGHTSSPCSACSRAVMASNVEWKDAVVGSWRLTLNELNKEPSSALIDWEIFSGQIGHLPPLLMVTSPVTGDQTSQHSPTLCTALWSHDVRPPHTSTAGLKTVMLSSY